MAGIVHATLRQIPFPQRVLTGIQAAHATLLSLQTVNPDLNAYIN